MRGFADFLRFDVIVQARNGFYWASGFVVLAISALLAALPVAVLSNPGLWVPALVMFNLQITTFFFVAGLLLLERDEGTLTALGASPLSPRTYLLARSTTLTTLAAVETLIIVWFGFGFSASWALFAGTAAMGITYTGFGVAVAARYESINSLLLPASVIVTVLLLPLLGHFELAPRLLLVWHPLDPALTLLRTAYHPTSLPELMLGGAGSIAWAGVAFSLAQRAVAELMRDTRASGGR
jgi:fluoroquinolone transport system permease protein